MKWTNHEHYSDAHAGILYLMVEGNGGGDDEPETFNWFVCPDDDDKCDERAHEQGNAASLRDAKAEAVEAAHGIVHAIQDALVRK